MFYLFILAHLVADFVLQPLWLVKRKRHWDGLLIHSAIVLGCMLLLILIEPAMASLWPVMLGITGVHFIADWWKVQHGDRWFQPPIIAFVIDQLIHVATIAVALGITFAGDPIGMLASSSWSQAALYASVYIIALFATPIAVMVWMDPSFQHALLAGQARVRSLLASAAVVSLTLFGGIIALPVTLIGLTLVIQRPPSLHPLDRPSGMLIVLSVASLLGATLSFLH